jgi:hypothetical protein
MIFTVGRGFRSFRKDNYYIIGDFLFHSTTDIYVIFKPRITSCSLNFLIRMSVIFIVKFYLNVKKIYIFTVTVKITKLVTCTNVSFVPSRPPRKLPLLDMCRQVMKTMQRILVVDLSNLSSWYHVSASCVCSSQRNVCTLGHKEDKQKIHRHLAILLPALMLVSHHVWMTVMVNS